jgi:hypothetical protein
MNSENRGVIANEFKYEEYQADRLMIYDMNFIEPQKRHDFKMYKQ